MIPDHECDMQYRGIGEALGHQVEMWECSIYGREVVTPYAGTQDTIEQRV